MINYQLSIINYPLLPISKNMRHCVPPEPRLRRRRRFNNPIIPCLDGKSIEFIQNIPLCLTPLRSWPLQQHSGTPLSCESSEIDSRLRCVPPTNSLISPFHPCPDFLPSGLLCTPPLETSGSLTCIRSQDKTCRCWFAA